MAKKSLLVGKLQKEKQAVELSPEQIEKAFQQVTKKEVAKQVVIEAENRVTPTLPVTIESPMDKEPKTRLSIDVSKEMHRRMKRRVIDTDQTIIEYVVSLIEKDLE